jgi:hypothetical protein
MAPACFLNLDQWDVQGERPCSGEEAGTLNVLSASHVGVFPSFLLAGLPCTHILPSIFIIMKVQSILSRVGLTCSVTLGTTIGLPHFPGVLCWVGAEVGHRMGKMSQSEETLQAEHVELGKSGVHLSVKGTGFLLT